MVLEDAVSKLETSRSITWCLLTLKASYLVKWSISTWSFMWWCQFIDWLKFETRPSSLLNFGTAYCQYYFEFFFGDKKVFNFVFEFQFALNCHLPISTDKLWNWRLWRWWGQSLKHSSLQPSSAVFPLPLPHVQMETRTRFLQVRLATKRLIVSWVIDW